MPEQTAQAALDDAVAGCVVRPLQVKYKETARGGLAVNVVEC